MKNRQFLGKILLIMATMLSGSHMYATIDCVSSSVMCNKQAVDHEMLCLRFAVQEYTYMAPDNPKKAKLKQKIVSCIMHYIDLYNQFSKKSPRARMIANEKLLKLILEEMLLPLTRFSRIIRSMDCFQSHVKERMLADISEIINMIELK